MWGSIFDVKHWLNGQYWTGSLFSLHAEYLSMIITWKGHHYTYVFFFQSTQVMRLHAFFHIIHAIEYYIYIDVCWCPLNINNKNHYRPW